MKKIFLLIAACTILCVAVSCGDDDEPKRGNGVFIVNTPMINHMVHNGEVVGVTSTYNKLTFDTVRHTASLELHYLDGSIEQTLKLDSVSVEPKRLGFYELKYLRRMVFRGYVDIFEGCMRYTYNTPEGYLVTSTMPELFFRNTESYLTYPDTTPSNKTENTMYQFTIDPTSQTAIVKVTDIVHAKDMKRFTLITAYSVPFTVTNEGFTLAAKNLTTNAHYVSMLDSLGSNDKQTNAYPFKTFNATIRLNTSQFQDHMDANFMIGDNATVTATGTTYRF